MHIYSGTINGTLNRTTILFVLLIVTSLFLPATAIMYASGSPENSTAPPSGFTENNAVPPEDSGIVSPPGEEPPTPPGEEIAPPSGFTENNAAPPSGFRESNNTGNAQGEDLVNTILTVHNQERALVGVPPLTWSDTLATGAQTWAQQIVTTGEFDHDPNRPNDVGENIASFTPSTPAYGSVLWVNEKDNWHGGVMTPENWDLSGHYTQMVWRNTQEVGCGTASSPYSGILVCRYNPAGNYMGEAPY